MKIEHPGTTLWRPPVVVAQRPAYPAPLLTSEQPCDREPDKPMRDLRTLAESFGWTVCLKFAEGYYPHATRGTPGSRPKASQALRMVRGEERAVAVRVEGSWASFWTWSRTRFFTRHLLLEEFKGVLI